MTCFVWLTMLSTFPEVIAEEHSRPPQKSMGKQVQCENGLCRLSREPVTQPTRVAPLPQASVDPRPQQSVLITSVKSTPRRFLSRIFRRR